jgi:hypothetical protein
VTGRWFSPGSSVSSTNKTDRHNITEILLNAALNTIKQTNKINITLNGEITLEEITSAIRNLKTNGTAPGYDCVINEYIKSTVSLCIPLYVKLFNTILDTGIIPEIWTIGII